MKRNLLHPKWFLAGAMAFGLVGYVPKLVAPAMAGPRNEDFEKTVSIDDVPREVRHAIDAEAHGHTITLIQHVRHRDREFVRVVIDQHEDVDKVVRFSMDGRILSKDEIVDADWVPPRHYLHEEDIRVDVGHAERVNIDRVPPRVRAVMEREAEGEKIEQIVVYRDHDRVIFQTNVRDADNERKTRVIQVTYDGHLFGEADIGHTVEIRDVHFDEVPRPVRDTIVRESEGHHFETITVRIRHDHTTYSVDFPTHHGQRWLTIDRDGHIISDVIDRTD